MVEVSRIGLESDVKCALFDQQNTQWNELMGKQVDLPRIPSHIEDRKLAEFVASGFSFVAIPDINFFEEIDWNPVVKDAARFRVLMQKHPKLVTGSDRSYLQLYLGLLRMRHINPPSSRGYWLAVQTWKPKEAEVDVLNCEPDMAEIKAPYGLPYTRFNFHDIVRKPSEIVEGHDEAVAHKLSLEPLVHEEGERIGLLRAPTTFEAFLLRKLEIVPEGACKEWTSDRVFDRSISLRKDSPYYYLTTRFPAGEPAKIEMLPGARSDVNCGLRVVAPLLSTRY